MSKLERMVTGLMVRRAHLLEIEDLGPHFRRLALDCAVGFRPGDKVQVRVAPWTFRTFTPFSLPGSSAMQLLVFHHAPSPASRWVRALSVGAELELLGPRRSIDFEDVAAEAVLFGDETSVAASVALLRVGAAHEAFLESDHRDEVRAVLDALGVAGVTVLERRADDQHLRELGERLRAESRAMVLTGKAQSIQSLRGHLADARRHIAKSRAYWAPGRTGLD